MRNLARAITPPRSPRGPLVHAEATAPKAPPQVLVDAADLVRRLEQQNALFSGSQVLADSANLVRRLEQQNDLANAATEVFER